MHAPSGVTPLHLAAAGVWEDAVDALLAAGALASVRDTLGLTPADVAREVGLAALAARLEALEAPHAARAREALLEDAE